MEFEPLIVVKLRSGDKENIDHELRKRGFQVLSSNEIGIFTYVVIRISHKLVVKLCLQENLDPKPSKRYSAYQSLQLANCGVKVILRSKSICASSAWVAHNSAVAHTLRNHDNTDINLNTICNYYGPYVALSFGFQELSGSYLQGLALVGSIALVEVLRNTAGTSAAWLTFYCSYLSLWNVYYIQRWKQRKATLFYSWGIVDVEPSAADLDLVQDISSIDDLQHWHHCLLSGLAILGLVCVLLLLAVPIVHIDASVAVLLHSGASLPHTHTARQTVRFVWLVLWALVPYALGDALLQSLCEKLTAFEGHADKMHAEQSLILKQVLLHGAAHYDTLLYRTLYQQDQLGVLQVAMLAQLTAHVAWMLYSNDMLLRESSHTASASANANAYARVEDSADATTEHTPTLPSTTLSITTPADTQSDKPSSTEPSTTAPLSTSAPIDDATAFTAVISESKTEDEASSTTSNRAATDTPSTGGGNSSTDVDANIDTLNTTNTSQNTYSYRTKATPLRPDNATTGTTTSGGSDSPCRFGFIPALLKRTVVDPGLQSARQAVTGDLRGAASTALGAAASATKEGADLVSSAASVMKTATVESADVAASKVSEVASSTATTAAAAADSVASIVTLGAVHLVVSEKENHALTTPLDVTTMDTRASAEKKDTNDTTATGASSVRGSGQPFIRPTDNTATTAEACRRYTDLLIREAQYGNYDMEKEYLYTTILFGYLVLFSLLCPVTPMLVLLVHSVQGYVRKTRLVNCRRPALTKRSSLHCWQSCWEGLSLLALCLHCLTLAVSPAVTIGGTTNENAATATATSGNKEAVWTFLLPTALTRNRALCMLVLHQVLFLCRQCLIFLLPDVPVFIALETARRWLQQAHLQTKQRLMKHVHALHATSLYQGDGRPPLTLQVNRGEQKAEGLYDTIRNTAGSALHMPLQLAGTLRSTMMNATANMNKPTTPAATTQADYINASNTTTTTNNRNTSPTITPREFHLSRLLQQQTASLYAFNPFSMTLLTVLPALLHQLNVSNWLYIPMAVLYFSYQQVAKDRNDKKLATGIITDPNLIKFVLKEMPSWVSDSQYQRVEWLNSLLGKLWPTLSTALEPIVIGKLQPLLDDVCPKVLGRIVIARFSLGTLSPKIVGVRLFDTTENTVRLDVELRWAGDPSVIIQVGSSQVHTPIEVSNIHLSATLRVELLDLNPCLPCFRAVSLTCLHKPTVEFSLTVARLDMMNIGPGDYTVASMVRHLLHGVLSEAILYPKRVIIPVGGSDTVPQPVGIVTLTFVKASHLKKATMFSTDPCVVARIVTAQGKAVGNKQDQLDQQDQQEGEERGQQQRKEEDQGQVQVQEVRSSVKHYTQDPEWGETHDLLVYDSAREQVDIEVYHAADLTNREILLGRCTLPLSQLAPNRKQRLVLPLLDLAAVLTSSILEVEAEYLLLVKEEEGQQDRTDERNDPDVLYPDLPLQAQDEALIGPDQVSLPTAEEEKMREEVEQQQHRHPALGQVSGAKRGLDDTSSSGIRSTSSVVSEAGDEEEEEGRERGVEGDDDAWNDKEVAVVAAQLLRTLQDPSTSTSSSTFTGVSGAWSSEVSGREEDGLHIAGALSVSGIHVRNLKTQSSPNGNGGSSGGVVGSFFSGPTSCYVQCAMGSVQHRTQAMHSNEAPVFTETFNFVSKHPVHDQLRVSVVAEPAGQQLGYVTIPLVEVLQAPSRLLQQEYMLQGGALELRECYVSLKLNWASAAAATTIASTH